MELIVPELAKRNGVTEQLKAENQMEWVRQTNACTAQAEAIVKFELIPRPPEPNIFGRSYPNGRFLHNFLV